VGEERWAYRAFLAAAGYGLVLGWVLARSWSDVAEAWYRASCEAGHPVRWEEAAGEPVWRQFMLGLWAVGLMFAACAVWSWVLHMPVFGLLRYQYPALYRFGNIAMSLAFIMVGVAGGLLFLRMALWAAARRREAGQTQGRP